MSQSQDLLQQGLAEHRAGRTAQARAVYNRILKQRPGHADARHLLGMALFQEGQAARAVKEIRRALEQSPGNHVFLYNLSAVYKHLGKYPEAEECCRQALASQPESPEGHNNLGAALHLQKKYAEAQQHFERAVKLKPDYGQAWFNLGFTFFDSGRFPECVRPLENALALDSENAHGMFILGTAWNELGHGEKAEPYLIEAVKRKPRDSRYTLNLGNTYMKLKNYEKASVCFQRCLELDPKDVGAWFNLGNSYRHSWQPEKARPQYEKAVELMPEFAKGHIGLGILDQYDGKYQESLVHFDRALSLDPQNAEALFNKGCVELLLGNFEQGWDDYFMYRETKAYRNQQMSGPYWDGSPLDGKDIFIQSIQGYGDSIHFIRYVKKLKEAGAGKVTFACKPELERLIRSADGVDEIVRSYHEFPPDSVRAPLFLLPKILRTNLETIPAEVPYIHLENQLAPEAKKLIEAAQGLKIGLTWQGNPNHYHDSIRSMPLKALEPLGDLDGVSLFSLQKGAGHEQMKAWQGKNPLTDLTPWIQDFADTGAMIQELDLILSIDSAPAHLAGALARPVFLMVPSVPEWRWLLDRSDSPWYPTMRIFRQPEAGNWRAVVEEMMGALPQVVA